MMRQPRSIIVWAATLLISGCSYPDDPAVIDRSTPPVITGVSVSPGIIDLGKTGSLDPVIDTALVGVAVVKDDDGHSDISSVSFVVRDPDGRIVSSGSLSDNGASPDTISNDGTFAAAIPLTLSKTDIGLYTVSISATDAQGNVSVEYSLPVTMFRSDNIPPTISDLTAPDTLTVPTDPNDQSLVRFTIRVNDDDGLDDILNVTFTTRKPDGTVLGPYYLYDDGGSVIHSQFGITSGDFTAGDGIYTITIPLTSSAEKNTYRDYTFQAKDKSGETSSTITKRIYQK